MRSRMEQRAGLGFTDTKPKGMSPRDVDALSASSEPGQDLFHAATVAEIVIAGVKVARIVDGAVAPGAGKSNRRLRAWRRRNQGS